MNALQSRIVPFLYDDSETEEPLTWWEFNQEFRVMNVPPILAGTYSGNRGHACNRRETYEFVMLFVRRESDEPPYYRDVIALLCWNHDRPMAWLADLDAHHGNDSANSHSLASVIAAVGASQ